MVFAEDILRRFCGYITKVFDFDEQVFKVHDSREKPDINTNTIWVSGLLMCVMRLGSLNAMETELRIPRRLEKLVGKRKTSADSIGRVFSLMDLESLRSVLSGIYHQLKRNKALRTDGPFGLRLLMGMNCFRVATDAVLSVQHGQLQLTAKRSQNIIIV